MNKRRSGALRGLAQVGTRKKPEGSTLGDILETLGDRSFGWGFMLVGIVNLLPLPFGSNAILGIPALFVATQLMLGRRTLWLPDFMTRRSISQKKWRAGALSALPVARPLARLTRERYTRVFRGGAEKPFGLLMLVTSLVLCLPLPLTGWLPAIACFVVGIGLVERDGVIVTLGGVIALAAITVAATMAFAIYAGFLLATG
ncbi:exopolysaccharide biosynthesis protein [Parvibaculum sp.]|jgi:hypothetical protein|uniref:exopolysaccharide biosynthesis protein n=1 Tax=Parvibaculum sp. TaxID=2024848 RepID=UPI003C769E80